MLFQANEGSRVSTPIGAEADFVVKVMTRGRSCGAHIGNDIPTVHTLTFFYGQLGTVCI